MFVNRLMKEKKVNANGFEYFYIQPLEGDILKWHFTFKGVEGTEYEHGLYHGYIQIPPDYPMSPPDIFYLNENGRFHTNQKICITITSYHKESWSPMWTFSKMLQAMISHFIVDDTGIGSLKMTKDKRKVIAEKSQDFHCSHCGPIKDIAKKFFS